MMKRLGDYIRPVDTRNRDLSVQLSQGICNNKYFVNPKQVAENPETHKVVRTGQFAYNKATTRNGEKISIALRQGPDCTVSSAYQIFEIVDENILDPEYLMMWFRRPIFDRYARFKSHGSAHEFFEWESMCEVLVPIPSIEKQREIVAEYNTLATRIETNKKLIATLEQTAQALFKKWSLESPQDCLFDDVAKIVMGQSPEGDFVNKEGLGEPLLNGPTEFGLFSPTPVQWTTTPKKMCENGDVLFCVRGSTTGRMNYANQRYAIGRGLAAIRARKKHYHWCMRLLLDQYMQDILASATGSTFPNVSSDMISNLRIVVPNESSMEKYSFEGRNLINLIGLKSKENQTLVQMQTLLLSKMGK